MKSSSARTTACPSPKAPSRWTGDIDSAVMLVSRDQGENWTAVEVPGASAPGT